MPVTAETPPHAQTGVATLATAEGRAAAAEVVTSEAREVKVESEHALEGVKVKAAFLAATYLEVIEAGAETAWKAMGTAEGAVIDMRAAETRANAAEARLVGFRLTLDTVLDPAAGNALAPQHLLGCNASCTQHNSRGTRGGTSSM
jgi:hypothetical protein